MKIRRLNPTKKKKEEKKSKWDLYWIEYALMIFWEAIKEHVGEADGLQD